MLAGAVMQRGGEGGRKQEHEGRGHDRRREKGERERS